jgi:hypothetical protein
MYMCTYVINAGPRVATVRHLFTPTAIAKQRHNTSLCKETAVICVWIPRELANSM